MNAEFMTSSTLPNQLPPPVYPEVAFIGRSNVGKSSLINALTNHSKLCRTSATPGRTQAANFFSLDKSITLIDLPGFGFAKVSGKTRDQWQEIVEACLKRKSLRSVFLLVDGRRELREEELNLIHFFVSPDQNLKVFLTLTKIDKMTRQEFDKAKYKFEKFINDRGWSEVISVYGASASKKTGIDQLRLILKSQVTSIES